MTAIVETGAGLSNANSLASVAAATAYHVARGNASWDDVEDKEAALIKATDYMQAEYGSRWKGVRTSATQALDWPRFGVFINGWGYEFASNEVPKEVVNACAELALRSVSGDLMPDAGPEVAAESVGPISTTYAPGARDRVAYKAVDGMLGRFLIGGSGAIRVTRA